jgi:GNAT superfamily N-acetyltransferase
MPSRIRPAAEHEADAIARLVNLAYEAERFFVLGDRTSAAEVRTYIRKGVLLVAAEDGELLVGCVSVESNGERGSFGMLAVHPSRQRAGVGGLLIETAERHIRDAGARSAEIQVVNLRTDLLPRYRRLGYVEVGTAPYVHRQTIQPCHFVVMRKEL